MSEEATEAKPKKAKKPEPEPIGPGKVVATWRHIGELHEHPKNPRNITAEAIAFLVRGMRRFGFPAPVVVWKGHDLIVAGHARIKAVGVLLMEDPGFSFTGSPGPGFIPVAEFEFVSRADADAYLLADNRTHELAGWDTEALDELLDRVEIGGISRQELGWSSAELDQLESAPEPAPAAAALVKPATPEGLKTQAERHAELVLEASFGRFKFEFTIPEAQAFRDAAGRYSDATGTYEAFGDELARRF